MIQCFVLSTILLVYCGSPSQTNDKSGLATEKITHSENLDHMAKMDSSIDIHPKPNHSPEALTPALTKELNTSSVHVAPNSKPSTISNSTVTKANVLDHDIDPIEEKVSINIDSENMVSDNEGSDVFDENEQSRTIDIHVKMNHSLFDKLCKEFISSEGHVDYKGFKEKEDELDNYLNELSDHIPTDKWSKNETMAYWINAYNAYTIKLILKNYPLNSIRDISNGDPWDVKWITLSGKTYSLNNIEHDILRPTFKDARIHFAVNCAAISCPPIAPKGYTKDNIDQLLSSSTRAFVTNERFNKLSDSEVKISKIFEWYAEDFGNIIDYLNEYSDISILPNAKVTYFDYDWSLNGK